MISRKELGSLRLRVQCHEERILDSQFYTPFVEFMLCVVEEKRVCLSLSLSLPLSLPLSLSVVSIYVSILEIRISSVEPRAVN